MVPLKSYLFEAAYNWILDHKMTPHILVDSSFNGVTVPREYVRDNRIILNIHPQSVEGFQANEDGLSFLARFAGQSRPVIIPPEALMAVYSRETSQGIVFQGDSMVTELVTEELPKAPEPPRRNKPRLTLVK